VIAHSGGTFEERVFLRDPPAGGESAEALGERWAAAILGDAAGRARGEGGAAGAQSALARSQGDVATALRAVPGPELVARVEALLPHYAVPVDGWALPETTQRLFAAGRQSDVPALLGWNADEAVGMADAARAPRDAEEYARRVREEYGASAGAFEALYPPAGDARAAFLRGHGVRTFGWNMGEWARLLTAARSPVFSYYFERARGGRIAQHGAELPYVFGNLDAAGPRPGARGFDQEDRALSSAMMGYWTAFAATGDPNGDGRPRWPPRTVDGGETLVFGEEIEVRSGVRTDEVRFFTGLYEDRLRGAVP
jgi:para-nitrobenzyl esterase